MNEPKNLFTPTGAWRKRQRLGHFVQAATDAAGCVEQCFDKKQFEPGNFNFSVRELQKAAAALSRYYFARNTNAAVTRARNARKRRKEEQDRI